MMKINDVAHIQEYNKNCLCFYTRSPAVIKDGDLAFKIHKEEYDPLDFVSKFEAEKVIEHKIKNICKSYKRENLESAQKYIAKASRRGVGKKVSDSIVAYKGNDPLDSGIIVIKKEDKYLPVYPEGWHNYYTILEG